MVAWSHTLEQNIMAVGMCGRAVLCLIVDKRQREGDTGRGRARCSPKTTPHLLLFTTPNNATILSVHPGSTHSLGQSPHGLILSENAFKDAPSVLH
jgi:hypothetical protein